MIILLIGSGAREHAIAMALNRASQEKSIYCLASNMNPGIAELCTEIKIGNYNDPELVCKYADDINASLAIIGPENPLAEGVSVGFFVFHHITQILSFIRQTDPIALPNLNYFDCPPCFL